MLYNVGSLMILIKIFFHNDKITEMSWLNRIKNGLFKSSSLIKEGIFSFFNKKTLEEEDFERIEEILLKSDMGIEVVEHLIYKMRKKNFAGSGDILQDLRNLLSEELQSILAKVEKKLPLLQSDNKKPHTFLVCGINGSGKTTTVAKLAQKLTNAGQKTLVAAADTFRAAAIEQLETWVNRLPNCEIFVADYGSDPASVVYRAYQEAITKNYDSLIIDTAGRLHNNPNLMDELAKCFRVLGKIDVDLPHCSILVIDGNIGQNALRQIEMFSKYVKISGLVITKLDSTAKGGIIVNIAEKFALPIFAIGVGEKLEDLVDFNSGDFVKALLNF
jgi:fused signal recognition particle receptor